ncbi:MAG: hypothetical protein AB8A39_03705, partial [Prochlorococcus sp.]
MSVQVSQVSTIPYSSYQPTRLHPTQVVQFMIALLLVLIGAVALVSSFLACHSNAIGADAEMILGKYGVVAVAEGITSIPADLVVTDAEAEHTANAVVVDRFDMNIEDVAAIVTLAAGIAEFGGVVEFGNGETGCLI